ncbi:hypothetical protein [Actinomyces oris]|nr:hypothetical protein [Actinomyces oris]MDR0178972.1 hypothetical protein [Actinomyces oris]
MRPGPSCVLDGFAPVPAPVLRGLLAGSRWAEVRCGVEPGASRRLAA